AYGAQDGSNEDLLYLNLYYDPINEPLEVAEPGNPTLSDPNRWQPLSLARFIDQSGNEIPGSSPPFLSPEWGNVVPFAMNANDMTVQERDGDTYRIFKDPGPPPYINMQDDPEGSALYKWGFTLVSIWASHLDPANSRIVDISPNSIGNISTFPQDFEDYEDFYNLYEGGDPGQGRLVNPATGVPYPEQLVPLGDYARVLAEFWADGPDSETPPGHWFSILNYVSDQEVFEKRYKGEGEILGDLEWDIKAYFALGGAVHDAAIAAWSVKGWYDYIRPVSAIRWMAQQGQSSDANEASYNPNGIPLHQNYVELVTEGDPLAGDQGENVGKVKLYTWRGPDYIEDPETDVAGVGWILAENWWPYQRPSFVTPPFAGYVSGHSTYSRAAAELMTLITGDEYFPGGVGEFTAEKDNFLVFERGPSEDLVLQWATYRDASDQCSLSRIWGGIHPPADDINGRLMGQEAGVAAFTLADRFFVGDTQLVTSIPDHGGMSLSLYPNPVRQGAHLSIRNVKEGEAAHVQLYDLRGVAIDVKEAITYREDILQLNTRSLAPGVYLLRRRDGSTQKLVVK
ncbi:MAG: T9SS type A sorting domain-containing protein, partial [Bacteroidota bacterium]